MGTRICAARVLSAAAVSFAPNCLKQAAWTKGKNVTVIGLVYDLKDGLLRPISDAISGNNELYHSSSDSLYNGPERVYSSTAMTTSRL